MLSVMDGRNASYRRNIEEAKPFFDRLGISHDFFEHKAYLPLARTARLLSQHSQEHYDEVAREHGIDAINSTYRRVIVGWLLLDGRYPHLYDHTRKQLRWWFDRM